MKYAIVKNLCRQGDINVKTFYKLLGAICILCVLLPISGCTQKYPPVSLSSSKNSIKTIYDSAVRYTKEHIKDVCSLYEVTLSQNATENGVITYTFKESTSNPKLHFIEWNPEDAQLTYTGNMPAARGGYGLNGNLPIDQWTIDSTDAVTLAKTALLSEYTFQETSVLVYSSILNQEELKIIFTDAANQKYTAAINPLTGELLTTYTG